METNLANAKKGRFNQNQKSLENSGSIINNRIPTHGSQNFNRGKYKPRAATYMNPTPGDQEADENPYAALDNT